ncbi:ankyrin repeat domain-containing protein [Legionella brunensis]|uniref:Ankyrin repeats (3 copies) n=1 Tax=Legionella brunensis TaxID=29422 RepID=A0A0W0S015_9GAMM|nr:ankyrin repeat domain-containing protein [Legionella brunensis]KTC76839.1 Ankyrin repeats (3 copies) [Legionella brunensis]
MGPTQFIHELSERITQDDYEEILKLVKNPETDINQAGRNQWTPLHCTILHNKPALLELFLLMGANPYGKNAIGTPKKHAELLDNPDEILKRLPKQTTTPPCDKDTFMEAIKNGNADFIKEMLSKGFVYDDNDVSFGNFEFTGLGIAVQTGSFEVVELLVRQGSMIQDAALQDWLKKQGDRADLKQINQLLQLEKQKQIQIMEVFCAAKGESAEEKLDACRKEIDNIKLNFDDIVNGMKQSVLSEENGLWHQRINDKLAAHLDYPHEFTQACRNMVALIVTSQKSGELLPVESFNLICKTERLIDNPKEYKEFLGAAKNCQMVAGGKLSAYIALLAGWAAKIVSAGHWGEARIKYANEKLARLEIIEEYAQINEKRSTQRI